MKEQDIIRPDWVVPGVVNALSTTRCGGVSQGSWSSLNLGDRCGDEQSSVYRNRERLRSLLPAGPMWLRQVHGVSVFDADEAAVDSPQADAAVTSERGRVLAIMTADCLPVLLTDDQGDRIGAVHAGWRGLCDGIIEATVAAMQIDPGRIIAWLGPAISQGAYEVGGEVYESFRARPGSDLTGAFAAAGKKWKLDLAGAARTILLDQGVTRVFGGTFCTYREKARFFSYRRDGITGRMASLVWLEE